MASDVAMEANAVNDTRIVRLTHVLTLPIQVITKESHMSFVDPPLHTRKDQLIIYVKFAMVTTEV